MEFQVRDHQYSVKFAPFGAAAAPGAPFSIDFGYLVADFDVLLGHRVEKCRVVGLFGVAIGKGHASACHGDGFGYVGGYKGFAGSSFPTRDGYFHLLCGLVHHYKTSFFYTEFFCHHVAFGHEQKEDPMVVQVDQSFEVALSF